MEQSIHFQIKEVLTQVVHLLIFLINMILFRGMVVQLRVNNAIHTITSKSISNRY